MVTHRQRPATARGVTFLNIEDETGMTNVIVDEVVWQRHRRVARESGGLMIRGMLEHTKDGVVNVLAERIDKLNLGLRSSSRSPATSASTSFTASAVRGRLGGKRLIGVSRMKISDILRDKGSSTS